MDRRGTLKEAEKAVCGDRDTQYGRPEVNFAVIANMWNEYISASKAVRASLEPKDVCTMMILMKVARVASGNGKNDNWVDIAGYAACGCEVCEHEETNC